MAFVRVQVWGRYEEMEMGMNEEALKAPNNPLLTRADHLLQPITNRPMHLLRFILFIIII